VVPAEILGRVAQAARVVPVDSLDPVGRVVPVDSSGRAVPADSPGRAVPECHLLRASNFGDAVSRADGGRLSQPY
jgi:hypothetical protein